MIKIECAIEATEETVEYIGKHGRWYSVTGHTWSGADPVRRPYTKYLEMDLRDWWNEIGQSDALGTR